MVLALNGAGKSMGREGNNRKKSKKKKESIEEIVNIFAETEIESFMLHSLSSNNVKGQNEKAINQ